MIGHWVIHYEALVLYRHLNLMVGVSVIDMTLSGSLQSHSWSCSTIIISILSTIPHNQQPNNNLPPSPPDIVDPIYLYTLKHICIYRQHGGVGRHTDVHRHQDRKRIEWVMRS